MRVVEHLMETTSHHSRLDRVPFPFQHGENQLTSLPSFAICVFHLAQNAVKPATTLSETGMPARGLWREA